MDTTFKVKTDCRHFKGDIPCNPHKEHGVQCERCDYFDPVEKRFLIIKLGAIGDVIRTTALLRRIWQLHAHAEIWWLTRTPGIVPSKVDYILNFDLSSVLILRQTPFDVIYNLDKDKEACALMNTLTGKEKRGFCLINGKAAPIDRLAEHKFLTGIWDDLSKKNKKSYQEEIFEICDLTFSGEEYILDIGREDYDWPIAENKKVVGLNTGCGSRWTSRLWRDGNWVRLAGLLLKEGYEVLLLGGEEEHEKNSAIAGLSQAKYFGYFSLQKFISLVDRCDLVVSAVTMAMHIVIALKKKLILFNNIFNPYEFELYNRGEIIEPGIECKCFYKGTCTEKIKCMDTITPEKVFGICKKWLTQVNE